MINKPPSFFILDVDGVLTDGTFLYSNQGKIYKVFGPHDHDGLKILQPLVKIIFVTADEKGFPISAKRIADMKCDLLLLSEAERFDYLMENYDLSNSIYMGDGLHDAKILKSCRFGVAPANARIEARRAAQFVTSSNGGGGAVLDASLKILELFFPDVHAQLLDRI
jgi:3-deoxy-D-manno-octulosonate 8-phosphate phosphatase (KDO 8-P phosphatase)